MSAPAYDPLTHDPLRAVWDALDAHDCGPHGAPHKWTAHCPAHDDTTPSLSGGIGADGRALVFCHARCSTDDVIAALDLEWRDLFPSGHPRAPRPPGIAKPRHPLDLLLETLRELGIAYRCTRSLHLWVADRCPACGADENFPLWIQEDNRGREDDGEHGGPVRLCCFNGCSQVRVLRVLAGIDEVPA